MCRECADYTNKKIGIWGMGIVGTSALNYFHGNNVQLEVLDAKPLPDELRQHLVNKRIHYYLQADHLAEFLEDNDYILPSPGIDLRPYERYAHKWLSELDIFSSSALQPIIAVTGTVGKTTVTHILGQLLHAHGLQPHVGGNIGTGMLDLLKLEPKTTLLELSSFQLELTKHFAPDLAIWTNFYPNHLDRHPTAQSYFDAKYKIIAHQRLGQKALVPWSLRDMLAQQQPVESSIHFFWPHDITDDHPELVEGKKLLPTDTHLYYLTDTALMVYCNGITDQLLSHEQLPSCSYKDNWLIIAAALNLLKIPVTTIAKHADRITVPEHRLEKVTTINNVDFYNDSKSTTLEATQAALARLQNRPIHLFLGGISKGIDRTPLIQNLQPHVYHVYCFGKEAATLDALCNRYGKLSSSYTTLESAFAACMQNVRPGDIALFSPAGASFDLFANYIERGVRFKKLVDNAKRF